MKVVKFGGSSLADAAQIKKVRDIIAADPDRRIVVVSAPGKRHGDDTKVTDLLIECARQALAGHDAGEATSRVIERYQSIATDMNVSADLIERFRGDLESRLEGDKSHPERFEDAVKAAGEDYCARLLDACFKQLGMESTYVSPAEAGLTVSEEYGQARVLDESYSCLATLRERNGVVVFPGFFGHSSDGHIVTFSRGGSDLTGAILAAAVRADVYENFTDVDGISVADPRVVRDSVLINELTYQELRELSYGGFSVFHEEAMLPVLHAGIPVNVRNTNNLSHPGTSVVVARRASAGSIVGVACDHGFCGIYVGKYLMNREKGFGRRLLGIIEDEDLSFDHAPSGVDNITLILRQNQFGAGMIERVERRMREEVGVEAFNVEYDISLLSVVGDGMRRMVGIAARVTGALARARVNIEMIVQGPSELTMILGVKGEDATRALHAIYDEFFGEKPGE